MVISTGLSKGFSIVISLLIVSLTTDDNSIDFYTSGGATVKLIL